MAWPYCESSMEYHHFERSMTWHHEYTVSTQWHGLTVSALMGWPYKYFFPIPPIKPFSLCRPTSFLTVLTAAPHFLSVLVGRGGWCCYHSPLAHLRLFRYLHISHQSDHLVHHRVLRRSHGSFPLIFWYHFIRSFPSVARGISDLCHC